MSKNKLLRAVLDAVEGKINRQAISNKHQKATQNYAIKSKKEAPKQEPMKALPAPAPHKAAQNYENYMKNLISNPGVRNSRFQLVGSPYFPAPVPSGVRPPYLPVPVQTASRVPYLPVPTQAGNRMLPPPPREPGYLLRRPTPSNEVALYRGNQLRQTQSPMDMSAITPYSQFPNVSAAAKYAGPGALLFAVADDDRDDDIVATDNTDYSQYNQYLPEGLRDPLGDTLRNAEYAQGLQNVVLAGAQATSNKIGDSVKKKVTPPAKKKAPTKSVSYNNTGAQYANAGLAQRIEQQNTVNNSIATATPSTSPSAMYYENFGAKKSGGQPSVQKTALSDAQRDYFNYLTGYQRMAPNQAILSMGLDPSNVIY